MRVVLFCGGLGMRMRGYDDRIPKPMVPIGGHPLLWWVMRYYAHFGHKDFVLCLGYKGNAIKEYFLNYNECMPNDFIMNGNARQVEPLERDLSDWRITFVDTGMNSNIGERLLAVKPHLKGEDVFLANYSDGLSDFHLPSLVDGLAPGAMASFLSVRPNMSFHFVHRRDDGMVTSIEDCHAADIWINGGFFILRQEIFNYIRPGDELVLEPFQRLIGEGRLSTIRYDGFWRCVDTFKDLQALENLDAEGRAPWKLWKRPPASLGEPLPTQSAAERWAPVRAPMRPAIAGR